MPPARQLFVHVGLQKTGTSYLQAALLNSREELARQGLDLVPPTKHEAFELMLVVRDRYADQRDAAADERRLRRFREQLDEAPGDRAVLSQESLAAAGPRQVDRLLEVCADREVHVVATVRDLARQLPSLWQEQVKAGATAAYPDFLREVQDLEREGSGRNPWIHLDPPQVLARWARAVPASRIHVVTVPPSGSPTTVLLERFAGVLGVDPGGLRPEDRPSNSSLGHVQAELLRRVNAELGDGVRGTRAYGAAVKRGFGAKYLAPQPGARKTRVPADLRPWCDAVTERQAEELRAAGYRIAGTLEDLRCPESAFADEVAEPTEAEVAASSVAALAAMLTARAAATGRRRGPSRPARTGPLPRLGTGLVPRLVPGLVARARRRLTT